MNENTGKKKKWKNRYWGQGVAFFLTGTALILMYYLVNNLALVKGTMSTINDILMPFYMGTVLAYLLCPLYNWTVRHSFPILQGKVRTNMAAMKISRSIATIVSMTFVVVVVTGFIMMVFPGVWESLLLLVPKIQPTFDKLISWVQSNLDANPELAELMQGKLDNISETLLDWAQTSLLPGAGSIFNRVSIGVLGTLSTIMDILVSLIICIYVLNSKESFVAQSKKFVMATFSKERADGIFELAQISNDTFGGFINGKLIDSLIIGIICFVGMTILQLPLPALVSVIVGITNIIPFFGPFIGAIPSAVLITIIDPIGALKFLVFVFVLQQLDGNVIGPKILGKATKLSSFWVMFAIVVSGGLFGFVGMILGVPVFAVMYTYIARGINQRLARKNLTTNSMDYANYSKYGIDKEKVFRRKHVEENTESTAEAQ